MQSKSKAGLLGQRYLCFLIENMCLMGVWTGEDKRTKHLEDTSLKEIGLHL